MKTIKYPKQYTGVEYLGNWTGLSQGTEQQLKNISEYSSGIGYLGLSTIKQTLTKTLGAEATSVMSGVDFQYDKRLDASITEDAVDGFGSVAGGVVDTGISGALTAGTFIRLVDDSSGSPLNVKNVAGLNLKVYAKNLTTEVSPPYDRIYVDPFLRKVIFPRPIYWSKCESLDDIITPQICTGTPSYDNTGAYALTFSTGKFGNGVVCQGANSFYPTNFNLLTNYDCSNLSVSFWISSGNTHNHDYISIGPLIFVFYRYSGTLDIYRDSTLVTSVPGYSSTTAHHIYVTTNLSSNFIKIYIDEILKYTYATNLSFLINTFIQLTANSGSSGNAYYTIFDNIKIWQECIDDPSFEYNSGAGRENALHPIYGSSNNYAPKLTSPGGVGYLYIPDADSPAILPMPTGGNSQITLQDVSNYAGGIGYFGLAHRIFDTDYSVLYQDIDFYYGIAWDGSGNPSIDKYDDGVSGALTAPGIVRIVNDISGVAKNLTDATGLNLRPVCKEMPTDNYSPPSTDFYIDPIKGKIILPGPKYMSSCESLEALTAPLRGAGVIDPTGISFGAMKFGNGFYFSPTGEAIVRKNLLINANSTTSGSISFWNKGTSNILPAYMSSFVISNGDITSSPVQYGKLLTAVSSWCVCLNSDQNADSFVFEIWAAGTLRAQSTTFSGASIATLQHFYATWNSSTINIYVNNTLLITYSGIIDCSAANIYISLLCFCSNSFGWFSQHWIDNIKYWNEAITDTNFIAYEASGVAGAETALHPIYGSTNGYKPKLTSPGGVGYNLNGGAGSLVRGVI